MSLIMYPKVERKAQSFKGVKVHVVPNQSMTLQEVFRRFIHRESLPAMKEGTFFEGDHDLEKLSKEDRTVMEEVLPSVRADVEAKRQLAIDEHNKRTAGEREKRKAELKAMLAELQQSDPVKP